VTGLIEGPRFGFGSPLTIGLFVIAALAAVALKTYEGRRRDPLLDFRFFRSIPFTSAIVTAVAAFAAQGAFIFTVALYLQEVRHFSPFDAGLHTLPLGLAQLVAAPLAGRLVSSVGTRIPLAAGAAGVVVSAVLLTTLSPTTPIWFLFVAFAFMGAGLGLINPPLTNTAVSGMPRSQSGAAAGVASTSRQTGVSLGVALAGTLTGAGASATVGLGFAVASHTLWWVIAGLGALVFALAFLANSAPAKRSTDRIADLLSDKPARTKDARPDPQPATR